MLIYLSLLETREQKAKIEEIYNSYKHTMFYVANSFVHNNALAEDIVHDSFIRIIEIIDQIDINLCNKTKALIVIIVKHKAIDALRKKDNSLLDYNDETVDIVDKSSSTIDFIIEKESHDIILKCINKLSDTYKEVCRLKYVLDYSSEMISKVLDIPVGTVNVRILRAKKILKEMIMESFNYELWYQFRVW